MFYSYLFALALLSLIKVTQKQLIKFFQCVMSDFDMSTNAERFVRVLIRFRVPCVAVAMAGAGRVRYYLSGILRFFSNQPKTNDLNNQKRYGFFSEF